jgi:hypothetical protein
MRVTREFGSYNSRRYGRPWIAKVVAWEVGKQPVLSWGSNIDAHNVEIEAEAGDIVRWGQRDNRGNNTEARWGLVQGDATIEECSASEAREHWLARTQPPPKPARPVTDDNIAYARDTLILHLEAMAKEVAEDIERVRGGGTLMGGYAVAGAGLDADNNHLLDLLARRFNDVFAANTTPDTEA